MRRAELLTAGFPLPVRLLMITVVLMLGTMPRPSDAAAQTNFQVDSFADAIDASPGDGTCATAAGKCTLRAAVIAANTLPGDDTITFGSVGTFMLGLHGLPLGSMSPAAK